MEKQSFKSPYGTFNANIIGEQVTVKCNHVCYIRGEHYLIVSPTIAWLDPSAQFRVNANVDWTTY